MTTTVRAWEIQGRIVVDKNDLMLYLFRLKDNPSNKKVSCEEAINHILQDINEWKAKCEATTE